MLTEIMQQLNRYLTVFFQHLIAWILNQVCQVTFKAHSGNYSPLLSSWTETPIYCRGREASCHTLEHAIAKSVRSENLWFCCNKISEYSCFWWINNFHSDLLLILALILPAFMHWTTHFHKVVHVHERLKDQGLYDHIFPTVSFLTWATYENIFNLKLLCWQANLDFPKKAKVIQSKILDLCKNLKQHNHSWQSLTHQKKNHLPYFGTINKVPTSLLVDPSNMH